MRRPVHLDFLQTRPPAGRPVIALACAAALALLFCVAYTVRAAREADRIQAAIDATRHEMGRDRPDRREVVAIDSQRLAADVQLANDVMVRLSTPWPRLFSSLEAAANPSVVLVGLQPEAGNQQIRIAGVARRYEDVLEYVGRLQETRGISDVFLASHETRDEPSGSTISFTVTARWKEAS